ncbi:ornithine carbamoyltransferase [Prosthecobacter vanneervenii]|uniref:Ornithine carbamoyltransferase n=1 Tax=Prosthecobacter vanneervenii TaxID=48466 RepID=A0A7W8DJN0_9BACT|nr:ornithine carbamoyltransferase [Prosthecobacter vanneervenii]MBB5032313.1 ornithine carbamoyltransferase [Prosthecobacter vanneervenii]
MNHLLSIEELSREQIEKIVDLGCELKKDRKASPQVLTGQQWALIFSKSSTRTRVSFEVGIRELGGSVMFLSSADIQLGRGEPIKDTARVMGRMIHGAVIRTFAQQDVVDFAQYSGIPTINALTDDEHPCQVIADLQTIKERLGGWQGKRLCFLGDGDCNMARSWIWASVHLGFELVIGAPKAFQPQESFMQRVPSGTIRIVDDPAEAVRGCDVVYTDVWVSMGKEAESADRIETLKPWQINSELLKHANQGAIVMHCLPAYRGKEITDEVMEAHADVIFEQAENRLHAQKAIIVEITRKS